MLMTKLLYTCVLVLLAAIIFREICIVWFDRRLHIGVFDAIAADGKSDTPTEAFAKRIVANQTILAQQLSDYRRTQGPDSPTDPTYVISDQTEVALPQKALGGVDITVQSVNISQILTALRKYFVSPNEINGSVTTTAGTVIAAVKWPDAPSTSLPLQRFLTPPLPSEAAAARFVTCTIAWARAAAEDDQFGKFSRDQFCDFAMGLGELYELGGYRHSPERLDATKTELVRTRINQIRGHYLNSPVFPDLYRLRADLIDLLPDNERTLDDLAEAQNDRLEYAMLSPRLLELSESERRLAAAALARPAIEVKGGKLVAPIPKNWEFILGRKEQTIASVSSSTGAVISSNGRVRGSAFVIGPGLALTVAHVLLSALDDKVGPAALSAGLKLEGVYFCIEESPQACSNKIPITEVAYFEGQDPAGLVVIKIDDISATIPAVSFKPRLDPASLIGTYAMLIGYPSSNTWPTEFAKYLIGERGLTKRVMPGRLVGQGRSVPGVLEVRALESTKASTLLSDISTSPGCSGAPLVDIASGKIVGVHVAGQWKSDGAKIAIAQQIPEGVLKFLGLGPEQ